MWNICLLLIPMVAANIQLRSADVADPTNGAWLWDTSRILDGDVEVFRRFENSRKQQCVKLNPQARDCLNFDGTKEKWSNR
jgi:hypothetical protein